MAIGTPQVLLKLADTTGSVVVNSGSLGTNYEVAGSSTTRASSNGLWTGSGRLSGSSNANGAQTWVNISGATSPGTGQRCISVALAFKLNGVNDSSAKLVMPGTSNSDGNIGISTNPPAGSGDFDISVTWRHAGGAGTTPIVFGNCVFGTVYRLAASLDVNTIGAVVPRAKLGGGVVTVGSTANFTSFAMEAAWPRLLHRQDFAGTGGFGFNGDLYYFAMLLDLTNFWSSADLDSINTDPASALNFSGAGGPNIRAIMATHARRRRLC